MKKGPLIAAGILGLIGLVGIIVGPTAFPSGNLAGEYILWFGIIFVGIGLIISIVGFIKRPVQEGEDESAEGEKTETTT